MLAPALASDRDPDIQQMDSIVPPAASMTAPACAARSHAESDESALDASGCQRREACLAAAGIR
jgi:hypothetical protein